MLVHAPRSQRLRLRKDEIPRRAAARNAGIDRLRGAAIALMIADHLLVVTGHDASPLRYTLTRAAMPIFAVICGHLATRATWRHAGIIAVGLVLPFAVPFVDRPNILVWLALGALAVAPLRRLGPAALVVATAVPLTLAANGYVVWPAGAGYDAVAVLGLMAGGALVPRSAFDPAARLPRLLAVPGRRPLTWYVAHLLLLSAVAHA